MWLFPAGQKGTLTRNFLENFSSKYLFDVVISVVSLSHLGCFILSSNLFDPVIPLFSPFALFFFVFSAWMLF